jgi:hypothetical protein
LHNVKWGEFKIDDLLEIKNTLSFNTDKLVYGSKYDYVTRTSQNQGILKETGFVNKENINSSGNWSLGLLQMDFFYRHKPWYAGQFVRKITSKIELNSNSIIFFTTVLNKLKPKLLSVLVRNVDKTFLDSKVNLPIKKNGQIDFDFIDSYISELELKRIEKLNKYLIENNLKDYKLTEIEENILLNFKLEKIIFGEFIFKHIFNNIKQGRRLKKYDQIAGDIPFVMAGVSNTGVVNHISNPVASFPHNSITIDIFGNTFYRDYDFGAGDDTGVYWNNSINYSKEVMLFFATSMEKSILGKFDFGKKLRSSKSFDFIMKLPVKKNMPDLETMKIVISAIHKLVIKDVVLYVERKKKELNQLTENANA